MAKGKIRGSKGKSKRAFAVKLVKKKLEDTVLLSINLNSGIAQ